MHKPKSVFDQLDKNKDGYLSIWEFYAPFSKADKNNDLNVSPEEFIKLLMKNERVICKPFERMIDRVIMLKRRAMKHKKKVAPTSKTPNCRSWKLDRTTFSKYISKQKPSGKCFANSAKIWAYV